MRCTVLSFLFLVACAGHISAQDHAIVAGVRPDAATARFDAVLRQALGALVHAGSYAVDVESKWGATANASGPQGGSHYRLVRQADKYRIEVHSQSGQSADLVCVNDGASVTTLFPARKLYSQHAANSPAATLETNKMLAISLQGSALDILLQRDPAHFVHDQAKGLKDHGQAVLNGKKTNHFELMWGGAKVQLWFAAEREPLLVQFTRTTSVPTGMNQHYEMVCTATFQWRLGEKPAAGAFAIALPPDAERVNEIYDALAGHEAASQLGKPLPKLQLAKLDGSDVELKAATDKKATVLIFWATWCAASVEDLPAMHKFVAAYQDRGVAFHAVNVGEQPGEVRRFTAKHPLVSTVLLDPRSAASSALRINELPAIAILAPDNTVRAILHGTAKELQGELSSHLDALLSGSTSSTARRTAEGTGRAK
jgi:thiol-disulfide isomerase/thioredoxin